MTDKVREQILKVRETGKTNMFDIYTVQRIGLKMGFYDMVIFIEENKSEYVNFILHGDERIPDEMHSAGAGTVGTRIRDSGRPAVKE